MIIVQGEVYLEEWHIAILKNEPESVRKRYHAIARTLVGDIVRITRQEAADMIDRSRRQLQRIVKRFREEGIKGLRFKSKKPYNILNKTPIEIEKRIIKVRKATGFGPEQLANIVNESLNVKDKVAVEQQQISKTTAYNILARYSLVDAEKKMVKEYKSFERDKPDELVQADLTRFNGLPILTMEDDHSRKFWAARLENETDDIVVDGMKHLHDQKYDSLLTDNGSQFNRKNSIMKKYCDQYLTGTHIWTSIHHPQTMGNFKCSERTEKISNTQIEEEY
jgi:Homeodomain-like domain-containing protein